MIEVYLFYLVFFAQILLLSVLLPRKLMMRVGPESDGTPTLSAFRWLNPAIALAGVVLLAWFVSYMSTSAWDDGPVEALVTLYFMIQMVPWALYSWAIAQAHRLLKQAATHERRSAVLKPRRLFDFVSPLAVAVAALLYPAFIALVVIIQRDPFAGFAGYVNIVFITLLYALTAVVIRMQVYGRKANPYQNHVQRLHGIGASVKVALYSCIAGVLFLSLNFTLAMLDRQSIEPLAQSIFFVIVAMLFFQGLNPGLYEEGPRAATPVARTR